MKTWTVVKIVEGCIKGQRVLVGLTYLEAKRIACIWNQDGFAYDVAKGN